jgi:hypothetical protein
MIEGITSIGSSTTASQIRQALGNKLDASGDGVVDKAEIEAALESGRKTSAAGKQGTSLPGTTSSPVTHAAAAHGKNRTAGSASAQTGAVNSVLKNYLDQCEPSARPQMGQGFTTVV